MLNSSLGLCHLLVHKPSARSFIALFAQDKIKSLGSSISTHWSGGKLPLLGLTCLKEQRWLDVLQIGVGDLG